MQMRTYVRATGGPSQDSSLKAWLQDYLNVSLIGRDCRWSSNTSPS